MIEVLAQIHAPDTKNRKGFTCGIVLRDDVVIEAAGPIKFFKGWRREAVRVYCERRGWKATVVSQTESA